MLVYEAIADVVVEQGVRAVFALVGQANMHLVDRLQRDPQVAVYHSLHESTALGMAEGFRRSSGRPAVCVVTGGAAMVNLSLSLVEASRSRTPLVVITGRTPAAYRGSPQTFDHRSLAATMEAGYEEITDPRHCRLMTRLAFARAEEERRPVVLDVATDLQQAEAADEGSGRPSWGSAPVAPPPEPAAASLTLAADRLRTARRPVFVAGRGAMEADASTEIIALADQVGALLMTTLPAHGLFGDHPYNLGVLGMFAWPHALDLVRRSDCVVAFGASLNRYTLQDTGSADGHPSVGADRVIHVTLGGPAVLGDGRYPALVVRGDARAAAAALSQLLGEAVVGYRTEEVRRLVTEHGKVRDGEEFHLDQGTVDPRSLCDILDATLTSECGVTIGTGHCWAFPIMHLMGRRRPKLFAYDFGSIGVAGAIGIGGAIGGDGRPMVVVEGDGSALMHPHNFRTMARYGLPVLAVVLNDFAYGAELHQLAGRGNDTTVSLLGESDVGVVARAFGCRAACISDVAAFEREVRQFLASPAPTVLDCHVSRSVVSIPSRRLDYGKR